MANHSDSDADIEMIMQLCESSSDDDEIYGLVSEVIANAPAFLEEESP